MDVASLVSGPTTDVEGLVLRLAAVAVAAGILWRYVVRHIVRAVRWAITEIRDEFARRRRIDDLLERELNHNGGESTKDYAREAAEQVMRLVDQMIELRTAQHTTSVVLDRIVERKALEHDQIWEALTAVGIDRRRPPTDVVVRRPPADPGNGAT